MEDELVALESIYGPLFSYDSLSGRYSVDLPDHGLRIVFWADEAQYPSLSAPALRLELLSRWRWRSRSAHEELVASLNALFVPENVVLFDCIDFVQQNGTRFTESDSTDSSSTDAQTVPAPTHFNIPIHSGQTLTDRKSRFQAHIARASCLEHVHSVVAEIKQLPRVASSTHVMVAYRFKSGDSNRDDDGEGGAGDRMLHLLERMNQTDIVAVVVRWYGGIQLGPDRFKDITGVLKTLIENTPDF
ncbi:hypothetical protein CcCBS67573_g04094 [Chytriomyces confervae]|uniref:Impact N-terminal domain-containing protein n=1 Tax=Chytriomyces confervae TaxID=246404 RepID=A0A507FG87_9FUNG|nr:hypothetical protein HDU80_010076 [Chytriomyces hyalinus]TPX74620.1 hypothetical protein CcCBS67573_g04094 [Chytriomyces confervae]